MEKDTIRLDFIQKWEVTQQPDYWFTILTQLVSKEEYSTLREFCDYGIDFEKMLDQNGIDVIAWHSLPKDLQLEVKTIWTNNGRKLTQLEKDEFDKKANQHWKEEYGVEID